MINWTPVADIIPEGVSENVRIEHFEISEEQSKMSLLRANFNRRNSEFVEVGNYTRLVIDGEIVMSDTRMEKNSNSFIVSNANGNILIAGLGLGMILIPILENPNVRSVTVIEQNQNVINLVYPYLKSDKLRVINADIFEWKPEKNIKYDCIYFDIWTYINLENIEEIKKLHYKFKNKRNMSNPNSFMTSWKYDELKYLRSQMNKSYW